MKATLKKLFFLLSILSLIACSKDLPCSKMEEHFEEYNYNPDIIKKHKIKSRTKIDESRGPDVMTISNLSYSTAEEIPRKKVRAIDYFNESGYLILSIAPRYELHARPRYELDAKDTTALSFIDKLLLSNEVETNIPTGQVDSTIFSYDNKHRIISKELKTPYLNGSFSQNIETFEYDDKNNCVKSCSSSENQQTLCMFTTFKYDDTGKIISAIIEYPDELLNPEESKQKEIQYTYYPDGKLKSEGVFNYVYKNNRLQEIYTVQENTKVNITNFTYDKNGNLICKEWISSGGTNSILKCTYDQENLITESCYKHNKSGKDYNLYKYIYE